MLEGAVITMLSVSVLTTLPAVFVAVIVSVDDPPSFSDVNGMTFGVEVDGVPIETAVGSDEVAAYVQVPVMSAPLPSRTLLVAVFGPSGALRAAMVSSCDYEFVTSMNPDEREEDVQEPKDDRDDDDDVHDLLDRISHREIGVRQPQQNSDDDQHDHDVDYRHDASFARASSLSCALACFRVKSAQQ
jgi:hypothetical protein